MSSTPILLNSFLEVNSYNGGSQASLSDSYRVSNVLKKDGKPHGSSRGKNFDLVLESEEPITLTNVVINQPKYCTCPIKSGAIWVSSVQPDLEKYSKNYDDFDLPETTLSFSKDTDPAVFFKFEKKIDQIHFQLKPWKSGKFIHIKFISCDNLEGSEYSNIDVGFIGLVGFKSSSAPKDGDFPKIPASLGIVKKKLKAFNPLLRDFESIIKSEVIGVVISAEDESSKSDLKHEASNLAIKGTFKDIIFFYGDSSGPLTTYVKKLIGFDTKDEYFAILDAKNNKRFVKHQGESIEKFINDYLNGNVKPHVQSAPRPPNDRNPDHPELYQVTTNSFAEIVLDKTKDVFLVVYADWCHICENMAPTLVSLAKVFKDIPTVRVCKLDRESNEIDSTYFPGASIPKLRLFPATEQKEPLPHFGENNLSSLVEFIAAHAVHKFDVEKLQSVIEEVQAQEEKEKAEAELKALKNVKKMHTDEEYKKTIEQAKLDNKTVVVDWTASWCPPCKFIAPIFASLSEEFPSLLFLKADVDELKNSASLAGVNCMPTFHFIKGGETVDKVEGANEAGLREILNKIK
eukprot:TRINITY_DN6806_c0_g1_i1.p1 TRINITY_DN6806_c0_g1~~TRINITY_DN6806_c0_g1_i1.p1  ORF type:complete len:573 (+),score=81.14 TRINITY_DN6806_c0_g1_i1:46-1764(+)